jgi:hypothetical protein
MSTYNYPVFGTVFGKGGTVGQRAFTSGIPSAARNADNSVERQKFTHDGTVTGDLEHNVTRGIAGNLVAVSNRQAYSALEAMRTVTERKVFHSGDWNIFNADGVAVGASLGTTDTDVTPSGVN